MFFGELHPWGQPAPTPLFWLVLDNAGAISWLGAVVWNRGGSPNGSGVDMCAGGDGRVTGVSARLGSAFWNRGLQATPRPLSPPVCLIDRNCAILIV
jgi:hypothetical protein